MNTRLDRNKLIIGAYILQDYARSEAHIRDLAACGIDMITGFDSDQREKLDLLEKYGVGCILGGVTPGWWGGNGKNAGKLAEKNTYDLFEKAAKTFTDHPAVWGLDIGDEPSALDFDHYGKIAAWMENLFPKQFAYLNLYPNYASVAENTGAQTVNQLGTATYAEHIDAYVKKVGLPYISYDFYVYSLHSDELGRMYDNFRIVADACRDTGRDFWYVPQVNSNDPNVFTSAERLRFQAYAALCYGASLINWACYTGGWWHNNVLDIEGNKTEQYEKLKTVNAELRRFGERYMRYTRTSTHLVGFENEPTFAAHPALKSETAVDTGFVRDLHASDGARLVVGEMTGKGDNAKKALVVLNATDYLDNAPCKTTITFRADGRDVSLYSADGHTALSRLDDGSYAFTLANCRAVLITVQ